MTDNIRHQSCVIFILGMHRSGTSAITRLLNIMGADLGEPLLQATSGINDKGFWEHAGVVRINEKILEYFDTTWFDHRRLPDAWWEVHELAQLKQQSRLLVENNFKKQTLIAIKDPRLCRLLPFWTLILQQSERAVKCVLALRNPKEVAQSIHKRDRFDMAFCYSLWLTYMLESELYSRPFQRVVVNYDQILNDWENTVHHISTNLGIIWPNPIDSVKEIVRREIRPDLQHQSVTQEMLDQDHTVPKPVKTIYHLFRDKELKVIEGSMDSIRNKWYQKPIMVDPEIRDLLFHINRRNADQAVQLHQIQANSQETINKKDLQINLLEKKHADSQETINKKDLQINLLEKKHALMKERIGEQDSRLKLMEELYSSSLLRLDEMERVEKHIQQSYFFPFFWRKSEIRNSHKIHYHFDEIDFSSGRLTIRGWIFSQSRKIESMDLLIVGYRTEKHPIQPDLQRDDVYKKFNHPSAARCGFMSTLQTRQRGNVKIYLIVYLGGGAVERIFIRKIRCTYKRRHLEHFSYFFRQLSTNDFRYAFTLLLHGNFKALATAITNRLERPIRREKETLAFIARAFLKTPAVTHRNNNRDIDIIIPVYNGMQFLPDFFENLLRNTQTPYRLIIVDDCSTDEKVFPFLSNIKVRSSNEVILLRNHRNMGFIKSVNIGYQQTKNHFVILNTDVALPETWLTRLIDPILNNPYIASTTPFTNSGTICSFPDLLNDNPIFEGLDVQKLDRFFLHINPDKVDVNIPTGVGFCMGINRNVAQQIGFFDEINYVKGYGEENDWCMRALKSGYRSVIVPNLFVYHKHGASFPEQEKQALLNKNLKVLLTKFPEYQHMVDEYIAADKLKGIRGLLQLIISTYSGGWSLIYNHLK